jgi:hypothetical protein
VVSTGPNVKGLKVNDWVIPAAAGFGVLPVTFKLEINRCAMSIKQLTRVDPF